MWQWAVAYDRARPQVADTFLVAALAAVSIPWLVHHTAAGPLLWACNTGLVLPLAWRRSRPVAVFGVLAAVAFVQWLLGVPLVADVSLLIAVYTVASDQTRRAALATGAVLEIGVVMATSRWTLAGSWLRSFVFLSGLVAVALLLGANLRARRAHVAELVDRASRLEYERDQQAQIAAASERTRIAREMHDVIAHSLAVIVSMSDGATAKLHSEPERAGAAMRSVSEVGRQALGETRRLLGILRDDQTSAGLAPQPGLSQIAELVSQVRATGLDAELLFEGVPFAVPPSAELAVYRIVQEATTNTLKHAANATSLRVTVGFAIPELRVEVADNGRPSTNGPASQGHGIVGMRERVSLYNGSVAAAAGPAGGWVVRARLSVGSANR
jgi:signal transduction histidine kinase